MIHDRCYLVYLLAVLGLAASCSLNVIYDKRWKQTQCELIIAYRIAILFFVQELRGILVQFVPMALSDYRSDYCMQ